MRVECFDCSVTHGSKSLFSHSFSRVSGVNQQNSVADFSVELNALFRDILLMFKREARIIQQVCLGLILPKQGVVCVYSGVFVLSIRCFHNQSG